MQRRTVLPAVPACKKASESTAEKAAEREIERATGNRARRQANVTVISGEGENTVTVVCRDARVDRTAVQSVN